MNLTTKSAGGSLNIFLDASCWHLVQNCCPIHFTNRPVSLLCRIRLTARFTHAARFNQVSGSPFCPIVRFKTWARLSGSPLSGSSPVPIQRPELCLWGIPMPLMGIPPWGNPHEGIPSGESPMGGIPTGDSPMGESPGGIPTEESPMGDSPRGGSLGIPMWEPSMGDSPMRESPVGESHMGERPYGGIPYAPYGGAHMGDPLESPWGDPPLGVPPWGIPPMGDSPMGTPLMGESPMWIPPCGDPPMGESWGFPP